ncbi:hypothetical protein BSL78_29216 [Apostichopus japonicus]|uniref:Tf2-1-like SH3-like domain-containing protein n=1 Tax=Stichopus japonicus TaxID=307972 RepID=A0A2G8JE03_STIJA|nr:hypothetical protein BSL78_29216 [Apostichopus japonicus]
MTNLNGASKAEFIRRLHQKVAENLEKRTGQYVTHANKGRKEVIFQPGDWVWLHLRQERFPNLRSSKLAPRGDGPFRVLERINNNAYRIELTGEFNVSNTFNVTDLAPFHADEPVLRTKPTEEGGMMRTSGRTSSQETRLADQEACPRQQDHLARLPAKQYRRTLDQRTRATAFRRRGPSFRHTWWDVDDTAGPSGDAANPGSTWPVLKAFRPVPRTIQPVQPIQPSTRFPLLHKRTRTK